MSDHVICYPAWPSCLTHLLRRIPGHTDRHFVYTPRMPWNSDEYCAYDKYAILNRHNFVIVLDLLHLKMEVTVSETCDVIRVVICHEVCYNVTP